MALTRRHLLASGTAGAALALGSRPGAAQGRQTLSVRIEKDIEVLDPAFRTSPQDGNVVRAICQNLVTFKAGSTEVELDAAEMLESRSDTLLAFRLKPGQTFSDGYGELTADDVKFSFERFLAPGPDGKESPYRSDWANLDRVEVDDRLSGRIILKKPTPYLYRIALADVSGCLVSRAAVERLGVRALQRPIGSGPYRLDSFEPKRQTVLRLNPAYAGPRPAFEEIVVRYVGDPKTAELAFRAGEIDFAEMPPAIAASLKGQPDTQVIERPGLRFIWIAMNVEKRPLDDIRVRQAIRLALDVDQMLLAGYQGRAPRANAVIPPPILGHWREAPVYRRDVAQARRLLAEAGAGGLRLKLTVLNQPVYQTMALVARAQLAEVGIALDLDPQDGGSYWSAGKGEAGKSLDLVLMRFNSKLDPNFNMQWFRQDQIGVWNWGRWRSPEFDALHDASSTEMDEGKRAEIVVRMQRLMDESAAFVWLTHDVDAYAARSWVRPSILPSGTDWQYPRFARG